MTKRSVDTNRAMKLKPTFAHIVGTTAVEIPVINIKISGGWDKHPKAGINYICQRRQEKNFRGDWERPFYSVQIQEYLPRKITTMSQLRYSYLFG